MFSEIEFELRVWLDCAGSMDRRNHARSGLGLGLIHYKKLLTAEDAENAEGELEG